MSDSKMNSLISFHIDSGKIGISNGADETFDSTHLEDENRTIIELRGLEITFVLSTCLNGHPVIEVFSVDGELNCDAFDEFVNQIKEI